MRYIASWPEPEGKPGKATFSVGLYGEKTAFQIDSTGKLGTVLSSARFKDAIKPMDKASEALWRLSPLPFATSMNVIRIASRSLA